MHTIKVINAERPQLDFCKLISILIAIDLKVFQLDDSDKWLLFFRVKTRILKHCMDKTTKYELRNDYV